MNRAPRARLIAAAVLLWSSLAAELAAEPGAAAAAGAAATPQSIIVTLADSADGPQTAGAISRDYTLRLAAVWPLVTLDAYCAELLPAAADTTAVLRQLRHDPRVASVQVNRVHKVAAMPVKDPYFDLQARTRRGGVDSILRRGSGRQVRIAVIDTGVDTAHPDLAGQITDTVNFVGGSPDQVPGEFHGTAVVGLISARPGNGIGIHGIAPEAELLALRACWEPAYGYGLCSTNTLAQALDYAIDVRARIINLSLAGPDDPLLTRLVRRAIELGAVVFGAVGEDDSQPFPAAIDNVIAVQQGMAETLPVAGARLFVPGLQLLSTVPDGRYDFVTGSSFATAHASGVAAVMLEQQPHLRASDLVDWLQRLHENQPPP